MLATIIPAFSAFQHFGGAEVLKDREGEERVSEHKCVAFKDLCFPHSRKCLARRNLKIPEWGRLVRSKTEGCYVLCKCVCVWSPPCWKLKIDKDTLIQCLELLTEVALSVALINC